MKLWMKILIALGLGMTFGLYCKEFNPGWADSVKVLSDLFLKLIRMIITFLVLASMTIGVTSFSDPKKLGRIGLKTLLFYLATTLIGISFGLLFAQVFQPGKGVSLVLETPLAVSEQPGFQEILLGIIPSNPMASLVSGNILQIIVFSLFLGVAINASGEKGRPLRDFFESLAEVMYQLTALIMELSPLAVFAIMTWVVATTGGEGLFALFKFLTAYYFTCLLFVSIVFFGILRFIAGLDPLIFFKGMRDAILVALSTGSSSATLPVSMQCLHCNLGVSRSISNFVLPLGTTMNMNGTAIFQGMSALFVAQAFGIELEVSQIVMIMLAATFSAIGTAGIPGGAFLMLSMVLNAAGLPLEGIGILFAIDRLRDMAGTVLNILGDAVVAVTIAKQEGELDEQQFNQSGLLELEESEA